MKKIKISLDFMYEKTIQLIDKCNWKENGTFKKFVFGDSSERKIYKIDIMKPDGNWEIINIVSNLEKLPFYSGLV